VEDIKKQELKNWANKEYTLGCEVLLPLVPESALKELQQGDVLASNSGNFRLVANIKKNGKQTNIVFISFLSSGKVVTEHAVLERVTAKKLLAIIRRTQGNPLGKIDNLMQNIENERFILQNIETLLKNNQLGIKLAENIEIAKQTTDEHYAFIKAIADVSTGRIENFGNEKSNGNGINFSLDFNLKDTPKDEYIKTLKISKDVEFYPKRIILASCIITNTIANAINLIKMGSLAGI